MYKIWNTLRVICTDPKIVQTFLPKIDEILLPTLLPLESPEQTGYEDDIVEILNSTVRISAQLAPNLSKVILLFPSIAQKFHNRVSLLSQSYNLLMKQVPQVFENQTVFDNMLNIAINAVKLNTSEGDMSAPESILDFFKVEGLLFIIMIIENMKEKLGEAHWRVLFETVLGELSNMGHNKKYYNSRLLGVLMAALYYKPLITIVYLVNTNHIDKIVELTIKNSAFFFTEWDRKVLVLGLLSLFAAKVEQRQFDRTAFECLDCVLHVLQIQRVRQNMKAANYNKRELQTQEEKDDIMQYDRAVEKIQELSKDQLYAIDPDDEGYDEDSEDDSQSEDYDEVFKQVYTGDKRRAKETLKDIDLNLGKIDEFQFFHQVISQYRATYGDKHFKDMQSEFSELSRQLLHNALISKKIASKVGKEDTQMPRKILKIKMRDGASG